MNREIAHADQPVNDAHGPSGIHIPGTTADPQHVGEEIYKSAPLARFIVPLALAVGTVYLTWRVGWTRAGCPPWLFWPLWLAELTILAELARMTFESWTQRTEAPKHRPGFRPTVDVVVICGDEPSEVLCSTLLACAAIGGEHRTIALDTIGRAELAEITSLTGATHLVTASPLVCAAEEHLNAALPHMDGELVVLLHGGEMPLPDLIDVLAGDFTDDRTWMAQGSQAIHDTAHRGHDLVAAGADESIHATTQRPVALCETSNWYGSAAMLRRSTIDDLGGVPTGSETPALQMSLRAARHGWRATCHHEPVVHSASPDVRALNDRYARWTTGTLRALRSGDSPLWARGFSVTQRLSYLGAATTCLGGPRRVLFMAVLAATLVTGWLPLQADPVLAASAWGLWMGLVVLAKRSLTRNGQGELARLTERWMLLGAQCSGWISALGRPRPDRCTHSHRSPLRLFTLCVMLIALGLVIRLVMATGVPIAQGPGIDGLIPALAGAVAVLCIYAMVLVEADRRFCGEATSTARSSDSPGFPEVR